MRWTERQQRLLRLMGLRVWGLPAPGVPAPPQPDAAGGRAAPQLGASATARSTGSATAPRLGVGAAAAVIGDAAAVPAGPGASPGRSIAAQVTTDSAPRVPRQAIAAVAAGPVSPQAPGTLAPDPRLPLPPGAPTAIATEPPPAAANGAPAATTRTATGVRRPDGHGATTPGATAVTRSGVTAAPRPDLPALAAEPPAARDRPDDAAGDERAQRIADLDWPQLRAAVEACTACRLHATRRQTVFGVGHPRAHWMIVGEAPGEQEDLSGEPFVGAAGRLLDAMLQALGLTRAEAAPERQVYIANTLKCRPPRNRNPEPDELAQCEPFLLRQIALVQPRLILAMGRFGVQALLRSPEPIGRLRGRVHRFQGVPLVVTYHPAYLLRNPADKARAWEDLLLAARTVAADVPSGPPTAA